MSALAQLFALIAALLHVLFFLLESLLFAKPNVWSRFGVRSQADAEVVRPMALNQGYYNLFLAIGVIIGVVLSHTDSQTAGIAVAVFGLACMLGASLVLIISNPRLARAALIQGAPPLLALIFVIV